MSQSGSFNTGTSPIIPGNVPISFVTDSLTATSVGNVMNIVGLLSAAGTTPVSTAAPGSGNTIDIKVQTAQAIPTTNATKVGLASFDSSVFTVDANGFVTITGTATPLARLGAQTGTTPVTPVGGTITIDSAVVAAALTPIITNGTAAATLTIQVQKTQASATSNASKIGLASFDSGSFSVDANGFVTLASAGPALTITGNSGGALNTSANNWNILGSGSITTSGAASTLTVQLTGLTNHSVLVGAGTTTITKVAPSATTGIALISQGAAADPTFGTVVVAGGGTGATTFTSNGVLLGNTTSPITATAAGTNGQVLIGATAGSPAFATLTSSDSSITFTPGANTLSLQVSGTGVGKTITGDSGGALSPTAGNWNLLGSGSITTSGAGSTLTTQLTGLTNHSVLVGAGTTTITNVAPSVTSGVPLISQGAGADPTFGTAVVAGGGTGATSLTLNGVIYGNTTSAVGVTAAGTNGQVLIAASGAAPKFATLTSSDSSITFTLGANTLSLQVSGATIGKTITGNTGGALSPTAGNWNILGSVATAGSTPVTTSGTGSTLTTNVQLSQAITSSNITKVGLAAFKSTDFTVDANGFVSLNGLGSATPFVSAYLNTSVTNVTGDGTNYKIIFDSVTADATSSYNSGTGVFTAPISGNYQITATVTYTSVTASFTLGNLQILTSGAGITQMFTTCNPGKIFNDNNNYSATVTANIGIVAGTTVSINTLLRGGTKTVGISGTAFGVFTYLNISYSRP